MEPQIPGWLAASPDPWTTSQLEYGGVDRRGIARLVRSGGLVRVNQGGFVTGKHWEKLSDDERSLARLKTHNQVNNSAIPVTYSHTSAARIFGLYLWQVDAGIHITQKSAGSSKEHARDIVRHRALLRPEEVRRRDGFQVTSLERTVVDCARILSYKQGLIIADHGMRIGCTRQGLQGVADGLGGFKGIQMARRVIANASALSESPGESLTRPLLQSMPIPMPMQQLSVSTRHGQHRLDFAWKEIKLALEFDGRIKYFDYAPTKEVLYQERRREKSLMEDGWSFIRLEWPDLFTTQKTTDRILRAWDRCTRSAAA